MGVIKLYKILYIYILFVVVVSPLLYYFYNIKVLYIYIFMLLFLLVIILNYEIYNLYINQMFIFYSNPQDLLNKKGDEIQMKYCITFGLLERLKIIYDPLSQENIIQHDLNYLEKIIRDCEKLAFNVMDLSEKVEKEPFMKPTLEQFLTVLNVDQKKFMALFPKFEISDIVTKDDYLAILQEQYEKLHRTKQFYEVIKLELYDLLYQHIYKSNKRTFLIKVLLFFYIQILISINIIIGKTQIKNEGT